jgi:putative toxin-antitoxin system antitoxin component (TIGR02293 family)
MAFTIAESGASAAAGYPSAAGQLALISRIREGFSVDAVEESAAEFGLSFGNLSEFGVIAPRTLSHARRAGRISSTQSDRIARFFSLFAVAVQTFGSPERARQWLSRPTAALDNNTPMSLLDTLTGTSVLEDLLRRIDHGVAT